VSLPSSRSFLLIALAAIVVMAPELILGLTVSDSYRFNLLWPEEFGQLFRSGHLYPRWLPGAWEGLGAPSFYFYPPLFFWMTSIASVGTGGALSTERFVPIASLVALLTSGLAMRGWLRAHASERRASLGAVAYMLAPYHLYDIYGRGALAEATAYASVPLLMLSLARLGEGRTRYLPVLSIAYCALLVSHLPSALLASVLLIPAYVAWLAIGNDRPVRFLAQALAGGLVGIGLAGIYLIPALGLLSYVNADSLTSAFYRPEDWFFWNLPPGPIGVRMYMIIPVCIAALLFAAGTLAAAWPRSHREALFWALLTIVFVLLIAGAFPPFWKLPKLVMVQFPWRALLLVEFTAVTMIAILAPPFRSPFILCGLAALAFGYVVLALIVGHTIGRTLEGQKQTGTELRAGRLDALEYLPAGVILNPAAGAGSAQIALSRIPLARAMDPQARTAVSERSEGEMTIVVESPAPTRVMLRRHYFPHWRLRNSHWQAVPISPERTEGLVTFAAPAGRSVFRLEQGTAPYEAAGRTTSLVAFILLTMMALAVARTRGPTPARP
jgi:hypothetical protein